MTEKRRIVATEDPVCGMTVDPGQAREKGLTLTHQGTEYAFCGLASAVLSSWCGRRHATAGAFALR